MNYEYFQNKVKVFLSLWQPENRWEIEKMKIGIHVVIPIW